MARKKKEEAGGGGLPGWMATYGDMVTLLLCFFVLLFSMSSVDVAKFKAAMSSFADQIDVLPGGEAMTDGELLNNGISQLNDLQVVFQGGMALNQDGDSTSPSGDGDETGQTLEEMMEQAQASYQEAKEMAEDFEEIIEENGLDGAITVSFTANYVKFTLQGEFLFDSGRADLKPDALNAIGIIATTLQEEEYEQYDIEIEGHTDNLNINNAQFPNNWILSSYRAYAVLEDLIETYGIDPGKIAATGYGEYRPIASNDTAEGRAKNRRVEIKILLSADEMTTDSDATSEEEVVGAQTEAQDQENATEEDLVTTPQDENEEGTSQSTSEDVTSSETSTSGTESENQNVTQDTEDTATSSEEGQ